MRSEARQVDHLQRHPRGLLEPAHAGRAALLEDPVPVRASLDGGGHREAPEHRQPRACQASKPPITSVARWIPISCSVAAARLD